MTPELPAFPCPHCHQRSFAKRAVEHDASRSVGVFLTHLHVCTSCGENYLSTVHVAADRTRTETWDYYLDRATSLRRVRRYRPHGAHHLRECEPLFVIDGAAVSEAEWRRALADARTAPSPLVCEETRPTTAFAERWLGWWSSVAHKPSPIPARLVEMPPRPQAHPTA